MYVLVWMMGIAIVMPSIYVMSVSGENSLMLLVMRSQKRRDLSKRKGYHGLIAQTVGALSLGLFS